MNWFEHSELKDKHAFLGASKYHWVNYDAKKIETAYRNHLAKERGTELHAFACRCIELKQRLENNNSTLSQYVNDAIDFNMTPEQVLCYSENSFGTADAICFKDNLLRIHDLKTGSTKASMKQLEVYAALFCLEYGKNPNKINIKLRIYQLNDIRKEVPDPKEIKDIIGKIIEFDKKIELIRMEA